MSLLKRALAPLVLKGMKDMPAVFLNGPRQAGKSTLAQALMTNALKAEYVTFDHFSTLSAAKEDPGHFLKHLPKPVIIDEIQRVPEIFRYLKIYIDELRQEEGRKANGQFLLTGSANILALPQLSDALVGRMEIFTLYPLSVGEVHHVQEGFISALFKTSFEIPKLPSQHQPFETLFSKATFPQLATDAHIDRTKWFESYLTTLLQRDVKTLAEIEKVTLLPTILKLIASRVGSLLNDASFARDAAINVMTWRRYRSLLSQLFLITTVPPWYRNVGKRFVKSPKLFLMDTALLCHLLDIHADHLKRNHPTLIGGIMENFVASELTKQLSLYGDGTLYHFRTHEGNEVDFVIERRNGQLMGIEVKTKENITSEDFAGLKLLRDTTGKDFVRGIVLYQGKKILPFGDKLYAMPISCLWQLNSSSL